MPTSWLSPALAVQRSTLTEITACALNRGVRVNERPVGSISAQVEPSELARKYWAFVTLTKCETLAPPVCNGAKTPGVPLVTQTQSWPFASVQMSPRKCGFVVGGPAAPAGVIETGARPPAKATTPTPPAALACAVIAKPLVDLARTATPSLVCA